MKKRSLNSLLGPLVLMVLFCCWNASMVDSEGKSKRPDINFYGTIEDHYKTFNAMDILIGGKYEVIPVYQTVRPNRKRARDEETKESQIDPKQNKILLDLNEVKSIELKHQDHPTASQIEINNRDYVEIIVTSINGSKKHYLIESSRKITCVEVDQGPNDSKKSIHEERELNMIHMRKMVIKGYKSTKDKPEKKYYEKEFEEKDRLAKYEKKDLVAKEAKHSDAKKEDIAENTANILGELEDNVKSLSHENPSALEKMKHSILNLLKSLREQLQKMLNMLQ